MIIPAYNEEKYLPSALACLSRQTIHEYELVVVDNNSTDKTVAIAKEYGAKVVHERQQGYVYALNAGLQVARGDVIAVIDADTQALPDWLETIAGLFSDPHVVAATGAIKTSKAFSLKSAGVDRSYSLFLRCNFAIGKPHLTGFNFAVRRETLIKAGGLDMSFTMSPDVDLGLRMKKYGKVVFSPKMTVFASTRRFHNNALGAFLDYSKSYWYTAWLRKPPPVKQVAVR